MKISGRIKSLNLGASFAPRMEQAASHIQDSSDLSSPFFIQFSGLGIVVILRHDIELFESRDRLYGVGFELQQSLLE